MEEAQAAFGVEVEGTRDGGVGADDAEVHFHGAPGGGGEVGPGLVGGEDTGGEDGADDGAAGRARGRS